MEFFIPRALLLALLSGVILLWKKISLSCQMHCSTVDAEMTLNTIVVKLRRACWAALLSFGSSPLLHPVLCKEPTQSSFEVGFTEPVFSEHEVNYVEDTDMGMGNTMFQNDPPNQHNPSEMCQRAGDLQAKAEMLPAGKQGTRRIFVSEIDPVIRSIFGEPALCFHLNYLSQKSHNCPLFLGSKSQGHISEDHI